jgi:predicted phosphate transport protein (TIGR00153 family)
MKLNQAIKLLLPRHENFFGLFEEGAKNVEDTVTTLQEVVRLRANHDRVEKISRIEALEHKGDEITHRIFSELSSSFITPFDREDIHSLASAIDDILDYIQGAAKRITLYGVDEFPAGGIALVDTLRNAIGELATAVPLLRNMSNKDQVLRACVSINSLENQADDIFDNAIAGLFKKSADPIELIKIKEILVGLETATDKCEDAANTLESIILKNT